MYENENIKVFPNMCSFDEIQNGCHFEFLGFILSIFEGSCLKNSWIFWAEILQGL